MLNTMQTGIGFMYNENLANGCYPLSLRTANKYDLQAVNLDNMVMDQYLNGLYANAYNTVVENNRIRLSCFNLGGCPASVNQGNCNYNNTKEGTEKEKKIFEKKRDFIIAFCNYNGNDRNGKIREKLDEIIEDNNDYATCIKEMDELMVADLEPKKIVRFLNCLSKQAHKEDGCGKMLADKIAEDIDNITAEANSGMFNNIKDVLESATKDDILDLISNWNDVNSKGIMTTLDDKVSKIKSFDGEDNGKRRDNKKPTAEGAEKIKNLQKSIMKKLCDLLLEKAEDLETLIEDANKSDLVKDLKTALKGNNVGNIEEAFYKLYKELRLLDAKECDNQTEESFWDVIPEGIELDKVNAATENTQEDLANEQAAFGI